MRARSLHTAALGAAIAFLAIAAPAARVDAASNAACTTTSGVTAIVDFTHFRGDIERGCAPGAPSTALAALRGAGFDTAGTTRYGDAFVCRIDHRPSPSAEACNDTPPESASWSFYYARPNDATWTYSSAGVLSYRPPPGTIVAFAFGNHAKPGVRPAAAMPKPPPTTTSAPPAPTAAPTNPPVVAQVATTTTLSEPSTTTRAPTPSAPLSRAAPLHATTSTTASTSTIARPRVVDRSAINHATVANGSGSATGAILAAALVVGLGLAAGVTIRARRRRAT